MVKICVVILLVLFPLSALASSYICGDEAHVEWYRESVDPSMVPGCVAIVSKIPDDNPALLEQQALLYTSVKHKYLKVMDNIMVEMTPAEQNAVDQAILVANADKIAAQQELKNNAICENNTLTEISEYWDSQQAVLQAEITKVDSAIAAVSAGVAKDALVAIRGALVVLMTMFIDNAELQWRFSCSGYTVRP